MEQQQNLLCYLNYFVKCPNVQNKDFESFSNSFYRNKSSTHYFCSGECKTSYEKLFRCHSCRNDSQNRLVIEDEKAYCTSKDYWEFSCQEKYLIETKPKNDNTCIFPFCEKIARWKCFGKYCDFKSASYCDSHKENHLSYHSECSIAEKIFLKCETCRKNSNYKCEDCSSNYCDYHAMNHLIQNNLHPISRLDEDFKWKCFDCEMKFCSNDGIKHILNNRQHKIAEIN